MRLFISLLVLTSIAKSHELKGKVIRVSDGDTVTLMQSDHSKHKIRLYGIDAPEKGQPFGNKSKKMLSRLVQNQQVTAECTTADKYDRNVCTLFVDDADINAAMVANGGAWVYREYYDSETYYQLEQVARDEKSGLWYTSEAQALEPWKWRKGETTDKNAAPVKLSKTGICHAKGTKYYNKVMKFTRYKSIEKCLSAGRLPKSDAQKKRPERGA